LRRSVEPAVAGSIGDVSDIPSIKTQKDKDLTGFPGIAGLQRPEYISGNDTETMPAPLISVGYLEAQTKTSTAIFVDHVARL